MNAEQAADKIVLGLELSPELVVVSYHKILHIIQQAIADETKALQAIVDKLPKDKEGRAVIPYETVLYKDGFVYDQWLWHPGVEGSCQPTGWWTVDAIGDDCAYECLISECCSTREAAEATKEESNG